MDAELSAIVGDESNRPHRLREHIRWCVRVSYPTDRPMFALAQNRTSHLDSRRVRFSPKAGIAARYRHGSFVPRAHSCIAT
jgi:hypothetical protein